MRRLKHPVDRAEPTRLGEGLDKESEITPEATERTASAIADMADEAKRNAVRAIVAVGTAGLRIARNSAAVLEVIRARTGISIEAPVSFISRAMIMDSTNIACPAQRSWAVCSNAACAQISLLRGGTGNKIPCSGQKIPC
jgi:hypothetical protein